MAQSIEMRKISMNVVPVLAGMELTFFAEDHMVLTFVFLMKVGVITYCSSVVAEQWSHRAEAFTALHAALPTRGWGAPGAGRGHGQDRGPRLPKGM